MIRRRIDPAEWAALREAVPSCIAEWNAYRASEDFVPGEAYNHVALLSEHVIRKLDAGDPAPLRALFDAFDSVYARADDDLEEVLRIGMLEDLIVQLEMRGLDLVPLWRRLGPAGRYGFACAYRYIHLGEQWNPPET